MVRNIGKKGFWISLIFLILYVWWTWRIDTHINREVRSIFGPETTTNKEIFTNEVTFEKIVHKFSFKYRHLSPNICANDGKPIEKFLVILVKSNVINLGHREAIRLTWGKFNSTYIKLVFMLGYSELVKQYIDIENSLYSDIVQQDFVDDYTNNTIKIIMAFNWLIKYCPKSKFVYFVDDDYFVNLPLILNYLETNVNRKTKNLIAGNKYVGAMVMRQRQSKWFVSEKEYQNKTWPPYLSGGSIVMDMTVAKRINEKIPYIKPIFIDDVYLGMVAQALNIELFNEQKFSVHYLPNQLGTLFSAHSYGSLQHFLTEWKRVRCQHAQLFQILYGVHDC